MLAKSRNSTGRLSPFVLFVITGGLAAAVNIGSRHFLSFFMPFKIAVVVAYLFGMTLAFALARQLVFPRSGMALRTEYIRFGLVNFVALCQVWIVSVGMAEWLFPAVEWTYHPELIAHAIGVASPVITSYLGHKHFSFRPFEPD